MCCKQFSLEQKDPLCIILLISDGTELLRHERDLGTGLICWLSREIVQLWAVPFPTLCLCFIKSEDNASADPNWAFESAQTEMLYGPTELKKGKTL